MIVRLLIFFISICLLLSCGSESSSGPSNENSSDSHSSEIPCNTTNEGMIVKPADSDAEQVCKNGSWIAVSSSSSSYNVILSASEESSSSVNPVILSSDSDELSSSSSSSVIASETKQSSTSSSSSEETKLYLCEDGETYVLDPANCEKVSSSSMVVISSSSDNKLISSSSEVHESSSSLASSSGVDESSSSVVNSSSSKIGSSSSEFLSSSSEIVGICKTESEDNCTYSSLYDERDGKTYKTVQIGEQWWMAENLNYDLDGSTCLENKEENCSIFGKLYTNELIDEACPSGWKVPSQKDWKKLKSFVLSFLTTDQEKMEAGRYLRATSMWDESNEGIGFDAFGYTALPGGGRINGSWNTKRAFLWTSTLAIKNSTTYNYFYTTIRSVVDEEEETDFLVGYSQILTFGTKYSNAAKYGDEFSIRCIKE